MALEDFQHNPTYDRFGNLHSSQYEANVANHSGNFTGTTTSNGMQDFFDNMRTLKAAEDSAKMAAQSAQFAREADAERKGLYNQINKLNDEGAGLSLKNEFDRAISILTQAISLGNSAVAQSGSSYVWRGRCYYAKKDYNKALDDFNTAAFSLTQEAFDKMLNPPDIYIVSAIFLFRAFIFEEKGDKNKAIADLKTAADWDWYAQAVAKEFPKKQIEDDHIKALQSLKNRGVEYTPQIPQVPFYWSDTKPKDTSFSKISTASIISADDYLNRAIDNQKNKEYDKAITNYTKVIELGGKYVGESYTSRGYVYLLTGDKEKALADIKLGADYGDETAVDMLKQIGIAYTPVKRA